MHKLFGHLVATLLLLWMQNSFALVITTDSGFKTTAETWGDKGVQKGVILLHGKSSRPSAPHVEELARDLASSDIRVIIPVMPWSNELREGTLEDAIAIINSIVMILESENIDQIFLAGHSMGGTVALIYGSRGPHQKISGIIPIAPGHIPHLSYKLQGITEESVARAREMAAKGKVKEVDEFEDINQGRSSSIDTTVEYYLSFYDLNKFPSIPRAVRKVSLPVLWIAGSNDRLTLMYDMKDLFSKLPANDKSQYIEVNAGHKSAASNSAEEILKWLSQSH